MRRYRLTVFELFPYTSPEEREEYYEPDKKDEFLPQLRYDRLGARNHCRKKGQTNLSWGRDYGNSVPVSNS